MAAPYKKTIIKTFERVGEKVTSDTLYWKQFQAPLRRKENAAVTHVDFSPADPAVYAVTSGARVQVYSADAEAPVASLSRFREVALGASFRSDGRLLVAGGDESLVRLYDVKAKSLLRVFRGHKGSVHLTKFCADKTHVVSGGNDRSVRLWDVPGEAAVRCWTEHQDYVRCGATSPADPHLIVSGSYDHTVRVWDSRSESCSFSLEHGAPVESVLLSPSGGLLLSAGGESVKAWDLLAGGRLLASFGGHHKTVTCLAYARQARRLLSAGLDRKVKVYDTSTFQVVHSMEYPAPILSVGIAADDSVLAVGMANSMLSVQQRKGEEKKKGNQGAPRSFQSVVRKSHHTRTEESFRVELERKPQLEKFDKMLKAFEYSKALDAAMVPNVRMYTPEVAVSVFAELVRREALSVALAGRDDKTIVRFLKFLQKHLSNPKFMATLTDVVLILLDVYGGEAGQSAEVDETMARLKDTVERELSYQRQMMELMGTIDTIFTAAAAPAQQQEQQQQEQQHQEQQEQHEEIRAS